MHVGSGQLTFSSSAQPPLSKRMAQGAHIRHAVCLLYVRFPCVDRLPPACRMSHLQQQLATAKQEAATAHSWRQRCESMRLQVEDLDAANARAMLRRHELVASYWPVMARLNLAEDAVAALTQQVGPQTACVCIHVAPECRVQI